MSKSNMQPLIWEAQKLLAGPYYGPISETSKMHVQLNNPDGGVVEPLVDQKLYCDMRHHADDRPADAIRVCVFALGACTYNEKKKLRKDVPELAIICTVEKMDIDQIGDQLEASSKGEADVFAFLESRRTGDLGLAKSVEFMAWSKEKGELSPTDEADFNSKFYNLLEQVGIEDNR